MFPEIVVTGTARPLISGSAVPIPTLPLARMVINSSSPSVPARKLIRPSLSAVSRIALILAMLFSPGVTSSIRKIICIPKSSAMSTDVVCFRTNPLTEPVVLEVEASDVNISAVLLLCIWKIVAGVLWPIPINPSDPREKKDTPVSQFNVKSASTPALLTSMSPLALIVKKSSFPPVPARTVNFPSLSTPSRENERFPILRFPLLASSTKNEIAAPKPSDIVALDVRCLRLKAFGAPVDPVETFSNFELFPVPANSTWRVLSGSGVPIPTLPFSRIVILSTNSEPPSPFVKNSNCPPSFPGVEPSTLALIKAIFPELPDIS